MSSGSKQEHNSVHCGFCPDEKCGAKLIFSFFETTIECTQCGQKHSRSQLKDVEEVSGGNYTLQKVIQTLLLRSVLPKRGIETIKVLGLSNYYCKLISPLLTKYGMDKETGKAKSLSEMNQGDILDCGLFSDRAFLIDPDHISIPGFGRDLSGSMEYLSETLNLIKVFNKAEERLVPIHADGDGHCLVHAISRALVGRELFWHPLRCSLKKHLEENLQTYQDIFKDFIEEDDWVSIIDECDPNFSPPEGELLGLRNIHVFGLANVLKRPIILLDTLQCMERLGDYSALFLPSMVDPNLCRGKDNHLNKPLCIAWSSSGHNHFIPLVGIKKKPLPVLPKNLLPKVWGVPQNQVLDYMEFDANGYCVIGGDRSLADSYILRLVTSMEDLFYELHGIHPTVVADAHHFLYVSSGSVLLNPMVIVHNMKAAVQEGRLYRCMTCDALIELNIHSAWFKKSGVLYNLAVRGNGCLVQEKIYSFPLHGLSCRYDSKKDELQPDLALSSLEKCSWCESLSVRKVCSDGSIAYKNKDQTKTRSRTSSCSCGYKHYWEGIEYDNLPQELPVTLEWNGKIVKDTVIWFQNESNSELNSNVYQISSEVIQKHFPGEFGSERLVQRVVDQLLNQTKSPEAMTGNYVPVSPPPSVPFNNSGSSPGKIIIGGKGVLHKEELGISETEKKLLQKIEMRASHQQKRQASETIEANSKAKVVSPAEISISNSKINISETETSLASNVPIMGKFVRVVTSDGRQSKLHLKDEVMTLKELQIWVNDEFQIPLSSQKIKCGFPPRELCSSPLEMDSQTLTLTHGDRIIVEICKQPVIEPIQHSADFLSMKSTELLASITGNMQNSSDILKAFENLPKPKNDGLDAAILSLLISANLRSLSAWEYSQKLPQLFSSNGLFYQKMKRDIGLVDKKHGRLPMFPEKVFCYNAEYDRLELCLERNGHYPVTEGVEENAHRFAMEHGLSFRSCASVSDSHANMSDLIRKLYDPVPFQGIGYSLKREIYSQSIEPKAPCSSSAPVFVRKGPGFSILSQPDDDSGIFSLKRLQSLANQVANDGSLCQEVTENPMNDEGAGEPVFSSVGDSPHFLNATSESDCDLLPRYISDNFVEELIPSATAGVHEPVSEVDCNQCIAVKNVVQDSGCIGEIMEDQSTCETKILFPESMDVDNS